MIVVIVVMTCVCIVITEIQNTVFNAVDAGEINPDKKTVLCQYDWIFLYEVFGGS